MFDSFELQRELVAHACPSGSEHLKIAPRLAELARPWVDEVRTDALGNVICRKKGKKGGKRVMLAAHMDVIGFMATFIDDKGFVWFDRLGGHRPAGLESVRVRFLNGTPGIIRANKRPKTLARPLGQLQISDLFIDIGAKDKKEADKLVKIGDTAVFEGEPRRLAGGNVMTPYADDLAACAALLLTLEQLGDCGNEVFAVFTAQEEVGCRGAIVAAYGVEPHVGFACDVCSTGDTPADEEVKMAVRLGAGPAVKIKDASVISSPQLTARLKRLALDAGVAVQDEVMTFGGTDTMAIQRARAGVPAACVSIPARNVHTPTEIYNQSDLEGAARLLAAAARAGY